MNKNEAATLSLGDAVWHLPIGTGETDPQLVTVIDFNEDAMTLVVEDEDENYFSDDIESFWMV